MKSPDDISNAISQFEIQGSGRLDKRVRNHVREAFAESTSTMGQRRLWHSRIVPLAAAAVLVVGVFAGLRTWDFLGTEAYAVTQTIEALREVETSRAFCTDWEGRKFEMWIRPDPATGSNDFICLLETEPNCVVISTPRVSYYYYPGQNRVRVVRGQLITSGLNLAGLIESLTREAEQNGDSVEIRRKVVAPHGDVIAVHYAGRSHEYEAWVHPETKLLLGLEFTRTSVTGEFVRSIEEIRYNEPVPDRLLHFECPDDAKIEPENWGDLDNPQYGLPVEGLGQEQACRKILTDLFDAVNAMDLDRIRKLIPFAATLDDQTLAGSVRQSLSELWDDPTPGLAGYEIGSPYRDRACPMGVLVPCVLSDHQGKRFAATFIVRFRQIEGRDSCVVVFTWDKARRIER